jgi:drug/metabolite transporter (DMT)-like permease
MNKGTPTMAIVLMVLCTIFTSTGQILWKLGVMNVSFDNLITFFNLPFVLGFVSYGIGFVLMLLAFRSGELSILYPIVATSYVWVSLISPWLFPSDFMNLWKWIGVTVILVSVSLLGVREKTKTKVCQGVNCG